MLLEATIANTLCPIWTPSLNFVFGIIFFEVETLLSLMNNYFFHIAIRQLDRNFHVIFDARMVKHLCQKSTPLVSFIIDCFLCCGDADSGVSLSLFCPYYYQLFKKSLFLIQCVKFLSKKETLLSVLFLRT